MSVKLSIRQRPARRVGDGPAGGPEDEEHAMSQYLILIYDDEAAYQQADEPTMGRVKSGHAAFSTKYGDAVLGGNALQPQHTATTLRPDGADGFTVTDGPFLETKEALGGYYLVEAADLDEAIEMAKLVPVITGGLEVRPIMVLN
jgi:hypothetical protein